MSFLALLLKPGKRTLPEVVLKLPGQGVGARVTRKTWAAFGDSYWDVTKVVAKGEGGKDTEVWGVLTWRGQTATEPAKVRGGAKPLWRWVPTHEEMQRFTPLVRELQRQQQLQARAAAAAAAAGGGGGGGSAP